MQDLTLFTDYEINSAETDMFGRIRLGAFVNILIQSAIKSADKLGFGWEEMQKQGLFWVLNRLTLQIDAIPRWYDRISVETWPKDIHKILYLRDFIIRNEQKDIIAKATTAWLALDFKSKRPKHVKREHLERFTLLNDKHAIKEIPEKIPQVNAGVVREIDTAYFDIDLNRHVTSTRYIDWMLDTFSEKFHSNNYPVFLAVNYLKEIALGDKIALSKESINDKEFRFEGENLNAKSVSFRGKIIF
jgi:acyl-ACP thioesterase